MEDLRLYTKPQVKNTIPGPRSKDLLKLKEQYVPQGVFNVVPTFINKGEGAVIEDIDGNILLDFYVQYQEDKERQE